VVRSTPLPHFPRGKNPRYSLDGRLGWPQSWSGQYGEVKILDPTGTRTSTSQSSSQQPVAIPTAADENRNVINRNVQLCNHCNNISLSMKIRKSIHNYKCQDPFFPHAQFQVTRENVSVVQFLVDATRNVNELEYVPRISSGGGNKQTLSLKAAT
jgi:hypothetical protein